MRLKCKRCHGRGWLIGDRCKPGTKRVMLCSCRHPKSPEERQNARIAMDAMKRMEAAK
jgi:hypothetical protein